MLTKEWGCRRLLQQVLLTAMSGLCKACWPKSC